MRTILLVLALLWAVPASAAIAIVQTKSDTANDVVVTMGAAVSASNHLFIGVVIPSAVQTVQIDGWATAVTTLATITGTNDRVYFFCALGDGADTAFTATTSGGAVAHAFALEASGATCVAADDTAAQEYTTTDPWALTADITTTAAGDLIMAVGFIASGAFSVSSTTGTLIEDVTDAAVGQYLVAGAAGDYDPQIDFAAGETGEHGIIAILADSPPAGTTPRGTLLGILP